MPLCTHGITNSDLSLHTDNAKSAREDVPEESEDSKATPDAGRYTLEVAHATKAILVRQLPPTAGDVEFQLHDDATGTAGSVTSSSFRLRENGKVVVTVHNGSASILQSQADGLTAEDPTI